MVQVQILPFGLIRFLCVPPPSLPVPSGAGILFICEVINLKKSWEKALYILAVLFLVICILDRVYSMQATHRLHNLIDQQKERLKGVEDAK